MVVIGETHLPPLIPFDHCLRVKSSKVSQIVLRYGWVEVLKLGHVNFIITHVYGAGDHGLAAWAENELIIADARSLKMLMNIVIGSCIGVTEIS